MESLLCCVSVLASSTVRRSSIIMAGRRASQSAIEFLQLHYIGGFGDMEVILSFKFLPTFLNKNYTCLCTYKDLKLSLNALPSWGSSAHTIFLTRE